MDVVGVETVFQTAIKEWSTSSVSRLQSPNWRATIKRGIDLVLSATCLLVCLPLLAVLALLICIDSPGPPIYRAKRVGRNGKVFWCLKLRTMVTDADTLRSLVAGKNQRDAILFKLEDDPRITRLGKILRKYSADELAQLWNVLKGDMSLVGPRPALPEEVSRYRREYLERLTVMPGITGLWQVHARKDPSFDTYIRLDTDYVRNWNLRLDFKIMVRTIRVVLAGTGE